jgi:FAD/FMN-containing dehydrogenase
MQRNTTDVQQALSDLSRVMPAVLLPGTEAYDAAVTPWNVAVSVHPAAVVEARSAADVAAAVRFGHRHRVPVAVQATGHGARSTLEGAVLVSTRRMTRLTVHPEGAWARAEAGVTWAQVLESGAPHGLAGLAGSAPGVGVVGYTTGGGVGPLARTHGLASDRVRAFEVVTGDGELRRATPTEHPDLFWGLRGGKGALGIVTAVELDLLPISEIYGGAVYFDGADAGAVLHRWATWSATLPREASTSVALLRLPALPDVPPPLAGRLSVAVRFAWTGPASLGEEVLAPVRAAATPLIDTVATMPYAALGAIHADPVDPMPTHEEHSLLGSLPPAAVDRLLELAGPDAECPQVIVELRQLGGALSETPRVPSAYCHRDAGFSLLTIGLAVPPLVDAVTAHARAVLDAMTEWTSPGGLPNFGARDDAAWMQRTYDPDVLHRLRRVSATYDPNGVLQGAEALRATAPGVYQGM